MPRHKGERRTTPRWREDGEALRRYCNTLRPAHCAEATPRHREVSGHHGGSVLAASSMRSAGLRTGEDACRIVGGSRCRLSDASGPQRGRQADARRLACHVIIAARHVGVPARTDSSARHSTLENFRERCQAIEAGLARDFPNAVKEVETSRRTNGSSGGPPGEAEDNHRQGRNIVWNDHRSVRFRRVAQGTKPAEAIDSPRPRPIARGDRSPRSTSAA